MVTFSNKEINLHSSAQSDNPDGRQDLYAFYLSLLVALMNCMFLYAPRVL